MGSTHYKIIGKIDILAEKISYFLNSNIEKKHLKLVNVFAKNYILMTMTFPDKNCSAKLMSLKPSSFLKKV